jgi:hypothetical protein
VPAVDVSDKECQQVQHIIATKEMWIVAQALLMTIGEQLRAHEVPKTNSGVVYNETGEKTN